jgi:hypothetical protein
MHGAFCASLHKPVEQGMMNPGKTRSGNKKSFPKKDLSDTSGGMHTCEGKMYGRKAKKTNG